MIYLKRYSVISKLPSSLQPLQRLAYNLWWSWYTPAQNLFQQMDPSLWEKAYHNPVKMLRDISQEKLFDLAKDELFLRSMQKVMARFENYLQNGSPHPKLEIPFQAPIAYFSAEFGLHESLPVYSGGLGILAGDHCKTASDLGIPLVGIGLLYKSGYFTQTLNAEGVQEAAYPKHNFQELPIKPVLLEGSDELKIKIAIGKRDVWAKVWIVEVGRVSLYLMDTDLQENHEEDREITAKLYGGGTDTRIAQEILLGIGGIHTLNALGIDPSAYHINEGHAAFLGLERLRLLTQKQGLSFDEAINVIASSQVFTTHTPVPAGHDRFDLELLESYIGRYIEQNQLDREKIYSLGEEAKDNPQRKFCMTVLALNTCQLSNGVSKLHGEVSREMWNKQWHNIPSEETPIDHITNGVHTPTWMAHSFRALYEKALGPNWEAHMLDPAHWEHVNQIPDQELWDTHMRLKKRLISLARSRNYKQRERLGESFSSIEKANHILDPKALTIGFARRFAPYKRATLLLQDPQRLKEILNHPTRPVQFIFAGKSHPHNQEGKDILQKIYKYSRAVGFEGKIVFIEDYDANVGRHLVQGVDVWLNNPLRPQEASGTSGQKVPLNGGINCSVLDGWWEEGYTKNNGWSIGSENAHSDRARQDAQDADSLYELLEAHIVPLYYNRTGSEQLPVSWIQWMKESMKTVIPHFNTQRMLFDYLNKMYIPTAITGKELKQNAFQKAKEFTKWKQKIKAEWPKLTIEKCSELPSKPLEVNANYELKASISLGKILPEEVQVEVYLVCYDETGKRTQQQKLPMIQDQKKGELCTYKAVLKPNESGSYGYNIRVIPTHKLMLHPHETGLIHWAS